MDKDNNMEIGLGWREGGARGGEREKKMVTATAKTTKLKLKKKKNPEKQCMN